MKLRTIAGFTLLAAVVVLLGCVVAATVIAWRKGDADGG